MTSSDTEPTILNADQEHAGMRAVVLVVVLVGFVIGFLILNTVLAGPSFDGRLISSYSMSLSCLFGILFAVVAAGVSETLMKRYWPSGRRLVIDDQELHAWLPDDQQAMLEWSGRVWAVRWYFSLKGYPRGGRERRLTAKYFCLACQLQQDDARFIVYGYLKGPQAQELIATKEFQLIEPAEFYEQNALRRFRRGTARPELPKNVLTGKNGPFWLAEQRRWTKGIELTADDFVVFYQAIRERVEE